MKKTVSIILSLILIFSCSGTVALAVEKTEYKTPFENSSFYEIGDYSIHYRVFDVDEPIGQVMLLHGFGLSTFSFGNIVKELNGMGYKCVCADFPSFGYSTRENYKTKMMSREEIMYSLMKYLSDGKWILAGHSMGGGVALNIATDYADEGIIEKLILFCPASMSEVPEIAKKSMSSLFMTSVFEIIFRVFSRFGFIFDIMLDTSVVDDEFCKNYDIRKIQEPLMLKGTGRGICLGSANAKAVDYESVKMNINIPVLMFTAENDNVVKDMTAITDALSGKAQFYQIAGGGHMSHENKAAELAGVIKTFLE